MKKNRFCIRLILLLLLGGTMLSPVMAQSGIKKMSRKLLNAYSSNSEDQFLRLIPQQRDIDKTIATYENWVSSDALKKKLLKEYEDRLERIRHSFGQTRDAAVRGGFDWSQASLTTIETQHRNEKLGPIVLKVYQVRLQLQSGNKSLWLELPRVLKTRGKWKIVEEMKVS